MEGLLYLIDMVLVIWLLVMVKRNDTDPEAAKNGQLGIFSMKRPDDVATVNRKK